MYLTKKRSRSHNKPFKWLEHHNLDVANVMAHAINSECFCAPEDDSDVIATMAIIDVCLESGEFWEFGDILVYKKV